jgi:3-oxoacyl-[acyl-carrier protein] reductase
MPGLRLEHKTAVVTGASSGIGRAIALRFAAEGAQVVVNYRSSVERAEEVIGAIRESGGRAVAMQADVAIGTDIERLVDSAHRHLGRIDIWANIAGADILTGSAARLSDLEKLDRLLAVDLRGTMLCSWRVGALMKTAGSGVILNMSWDHVLHGMEGRNPEMFGAVKGGVYSFSKCLARSLAPAVRVNVLSPGWIETAFAREEMPKEAYHAVRERTPLRSWGKPDDVAGAALYLASDEAAFVTGQFLAVNGGLV